MAVPRGPAEIVALNQFRSLVQDLGFEDGLLLRFLRARDLDLSRGEDMLRRYVEWRAKALCNQYLDWVTPKEFQNVDFYLSGFDGEGRPILWLHYGSWPSFRDFLDEGMLPDFLKWVGKFMENIHQLLLQTRCQQFTTIFDCEGITYSKMFHETRSLTLLRTVAGLMSDYEKYFPEILHKAFMINVPTPFMWLWKFCSVGFDTNTNSKITFYGSSPQARKQWEEDIYEEIPIKAIPPRYGGSGRLTSINEDFIGVWRKHCED